MIAKRAGVLLAALILASGCTRVVDGTLRAATGLAPSPVTGRSVQQVLLDDAELQKVLDQPFHSDPDLPRRSGDDAFDRRSDISDPDCAAVVGQMQQSSYDAADVRDAVREIWWGPTDDHDVRVIDVAESVVALPTAADADALFDAFIQQWEHCDGTEVSSRGDTFTLTGPKVADSVLSARSNFRFDTGAIPGVRAVGVRVNCIVEVEVAFYRDPSGDDKTSAVDLVHQMMDKVTDLS